MAVYDPEPEKVGYDPKTSTPAEDAEQDLDALSPEQLEELEQKYSTDDDLDEDRSIEKGYNEADELRRRGMGRKLREHADKNDPANSFFKDEAADKHNVSIKGLKGKLVGTTKKKMVAGGIGAGLVMILLVIGSFFGFLNVFKLNHIMENIEQKAFSRYQVAMSGRSDRWMRSYMIARLSEITPTTDGVDIPNSDYNEKNVMLFRSDGVDTNQPLKDWYRTLRTSSFEADLLKDYGIKFTSVAYQEDGITKFRAGMIEIDGSPHTNIDLGKSGTVIDVNQIDSKYIKDLGLKDGLDLKVTEFENDKDARRAIKTAVNEKTHWWQVIKRRHIRKNIQNIIGVRSWRFFEKTRNTIYEKRIALRNKIIKAALPESTKAGKIVQCLFGANTCKSNRDVNNASNKSVTPSFTGEKAPTTEDVLDSNTVNEDGKVYKDGQVINDKINNNETANLLDNASKQAAKEAGEELTVAGIKTSTIKSILSKFNLATGIVSMVDTLARVDKMFSNNSIIKMVTVARGAQAMGLFTTYQIAADQLKTGEATGEEVDLFMQTLGSVSNSEAWSSVINSTNSASAESETSLVAASNREEYCSEEHQAAIEDPSPEDFAVAESEFHYNCENKKIGSYTNAERITNWWNNSFGTVLDPIFAVYNATHLSSIFDGIFNIIGKIAEPIVNTALKVTGLEDDVETVMAWAMTETASVLGAGPMMNGTEPSGVYMNMLVQGGTYTAESSARTQGARLSQPEDIELTQQMVTAYNDEQTDSQSVFSKYFSLNNPESALSQGLFASIENTTVNNIAGMFGNFIKSIARVPSNIFSKSVSATTSSSYAAANFAGIETYDFPQECYDLDPLTMTPQGITNANKILQENGKDAFTKDELTWDLVNNTEAFYNALYQKIGDNDNADDIAVQVYNCAALDTTVRGSLGYVYGYDNDYGLSDATTSTSGPLNIVTGDTTNIPCAAGTDQGVADGYKNKNLVKIRICNVQGIIVNSQISGQIDTLLNAAHADGINLSGWGFRTMAEQQRLWDNRDGDTPVAPPGTSRHQMGFAIDFTYNGATIKCNGSRVSNVCIQSRVNPGFNWLYDHQGQENPLLNLKSEAWHWSVDGH